ncbi:L-glutamate gamma-semialdehyde dehydrogenase [Dactylosporangium aurantiacum]|uniref:L-glutamate gamma-semialdehyde dehydrogenase n=1 Tax=Dactylosporangium aurantiacum TaxID=35754 RepID=A0A9Q9MCE2_9ACTN|nr:L-glutamate gamma-semialdehyde dehydrogenase [Dactylosporangium aurantiacum]MDG6108363.1 L-glutamate gamma-semialdehyde dehydrogenase [Dactylosporangium aurantiacum]UWZ53903.1 L-glutamate gamma-semialdehyde dehydrogenase [Dactylosporangium aurantiacum]
MDGLFAVPDPTNEPVRGYAPGSAERESLQRRLAELAGERHELTMTIDGRQRMAAGEPIDVVQPHRHRHVLGVTHNATTADAAAAVDAAKRAAPAWRDLPFSERAAVFLRAADLLAGPWRDTLNAATMLGQSKTAIQAEIDSACELIDFLRFNVHFAQQILAEQPKSSPGVWNRFDHRPLEGFVYAITPFNFTAIAGNLPSAPALMGNTVVWKPSPTQQLAAHYTMRLFEAAGLPAGVINLVTGDGLATSEVALADRDLAGIHFTGSTAVFRTLNRTVAEREYRSYPRIVGETGGKDFVIAHPSADPAALTTALIRGAFEYQGQKCSAASRAYVPASIWSAIKDQLVTTAEGLAYGDVTDFANFGGAVIDRRAFERHAQALDRIKNSASCTVVAGGTTDDSEGFFVRPTVVEATDPAHEVFTTEYFGPILGVHVYPDADYDAVVTQAESVAPYALTGSIFATDRQAIERASHALRFAAGNFYVNDKPTGAVVGQQPFGGGRASGTNDKAGSWHNLLRWTSPRTIKETFVPPTDHRYPHMG